MTHLSRDIVEASIGRIDDLKMAEIIGSGATREELLEAKRWVSGYKRTLGEQTALRPSVVTRLCDILRAEEPDWFDS
jgi:hypothetical protein